MFRPQMSIGSRIDQLRTHSDVIIRALHASFKNMGHAQGFSDVTQTALWPGFILHCRCPTDHLKIRDLCKHGENLVLDAVCEISVLLVRTEIFERQDSNALLGNCQSRVRTTPF